MDFEIVGELSGVEVIARGSGVKASGASCEVWLRRVAEVEGCRNRSFTQRKPSPRGGALGMKLTGSARKNLRSSGSSTRKPARPTRGRAKHVVCVQSRGYVDLVPLKVYRVLADKSAAAEGMLRVIDESGEDYLFPATYFRPVTAPPGLFDLVAELAR